MIGSVLVLCVGQAAARHTRSQKAEWHRGLLGGNVCARGGVTEPGGAPDRPPLLPPALGRIPLRALFISGEESFFLSF